LVIGTLIALAGLVNSAVSYDYLFYSSQHIDVWVGILASLIMLVIGLGYPLLFIWKNPDYNFTDLFKLNLAIWFVFEAISMLLGDYVNPMAYGHDAIRGLFSVKEFWVSLLVLTGFYLFFTVFSSAMIGIYYVIVRIKCLNRHYRIYSLSVYLTVITVIITWLIQEPY
jgi:hypothetical protein